MQTEVFVVYRTVLGACNALFVYAICSSEKKARIARGKVAGFKKAGAFYDVDPACSLYAAQLRILRIKLDCLYTLGLLCKGSEAVV